MSATPPPVSSSHESPVSLPARSSAHSPASLTDLAARLRAAGCVFAEDEAELLASAAGTAEEFDAMAERRAAGLPLEHVLGWAEFCGTRIAVEPGVFVPRRRTEFLVRQAAALTGPGALVVDLCCGSGALGAALAAAVAPAEQRPYGGGESYHGSASYEPVERLGRIELHAADVDPAAVRCARRNVAAAGGHVHEGDLYEALPRRLRGRIEVLLANVPYVPSGSVSLLPAEARVHEPLVALDGGADGLDVLRRVAAGAARWLAPGGSVLMETGEAQAGEAAAAMESLGLTARVAGCEELGATVLIGTRPAGEASEGPR
ncbi:HemK family protein methyltransferase [Streptomyces winkii]|uniref:HemK family protein methyltransferase n=1 Tax=Streptomyces winkii TaxID=3051178 RepID=UPI0028D7198C|nr:HemK family protein methyltransferase [Streptomyces sp. DSM 40971]